MKLSKPYSILLVLAFGMLGTAHVHAGLVDARINVDESRLVFNGPCNRRFSVPIKLGFKVSSTPTRIKYQVNISGRLLHKSFPMRTITVNRPGVWHYIRISANLPSHGRGDGVGRTGYSVYLRTYQPRRLTKVKVFHMSCGGFADLTPVRIRADKPGTPPIFKPGNSLRVTYFVRNAGRVTALPRSDKIYIVVRNPRNSDYIRKYTLATNRVGSLHGGRVGRYSVGTHIPRHIETSFYDNRSHWLCVRVNASASGRRPVAESNFHNNERCTRIKVVSWHSHGRVLDYTIRILSASIDRNGRIRARVKIANRGERQRATPVGIILTASMGSRERVIVRTRAGTGRGWSRTIQMNGTAPLTGLPGSRIRICAVVDPRNHVRETNEGNNRHCRIVRLPNRVGIPATRRHPFGNR